MKRTSLGLSVLLLAALLVSLLPVPALAQGGDRYEDPAGRFSVPIPAGWTDESTDEYAYFVSPDGQAHYYVMAVEAADLEAGTAAALAIAVPGFSGEPIQSVQVPLGGSTWLQNVYTTEDGNLILVLAQMRAGTAYVVLEWGPQAALQAVNNAILASFSGLEIAAEPDAVPTYADPAGRFTMPIPAGWDDQSTEAYGHFVNAQPPADLFALAVDESDVHAGIAAALAIIEPGFEQEPVQSSPVPAPNGVWTQNIYALESVDLIAALGQAQGDAVIVVAIRAPQASFQAITPALNIALLGVTFAPTGDEIDLSAAQPGALTDELLAEFEAYVTEAVERYAIPGVSVAVVQGDEVVYAQGFGVRELGQDAPVTAETVFGVGSVSKAVNATFIAALVSAGVLAWDTPVTDLLPDFALSDPARTATVRVRDLLSNSSGIERADLVWLGTEITAEAIIESLADLPIIAQQGERFGYSNQMVAAGGYLGARAAGGEWGGLDDAYVRAVQEYVLTPAGMDTATYSVQEAQEGQNVAQPHDFTLAGEVFPTPYQDLMGILPAGGLNASALDMARFLMVQLSGGVAQDGTRVASEEALAETWQPQVEIESTMVERSLFAPDSIVQYGMGWFVEDFHGLRILSHAGDTEGFSSLIAFIPDANIGIVVLNNKLGASSFNAAVQYRLVELLYGLEPAIDAFFEAGRAQTESALSVFAASLELNVDPAAVEPYLGSYSDNTALELREDGTFWMTRGGYAWRLVPGPQGRYLFYNGLFLGRTLEIAENEEGRTSLLLEGALELAHSVD